MVAKLALPVVLSLALAGCGGSVAPRAAEGPRVSAPARSPISPDGKLCLTELAAQRAAFSPLPDRYHGPGCSVVGAVNLTAVGADAGRLAITNLGPLTCNAATTLAGWARYGVDRAARQILGSPLRSIETMGSYACRNVGGSSRRSAHARADAIDIGAFVLADGRRITVRGGWTGSREEREFLRVVHRSACKRFGTVLGPDYNAAHEDHLHLERGDGSFCR